MLDSNKNKIKEIGRIKDGYHGSFFYNKKRETFISYDCQVINPTTSLIIIVYSQVVFSCVRGKPYGFYLEPTLLIILPHQYHKFSKVRRPQVKL